MAYDPNNVFAKILRGELPASKLFEDTHSFALMDIMPQSEGHSLILTKEPAETLLDVSPEGAAACIRTTQLIARATQKALGVPGLRVMQMTGAASGQTVPHLHFHVIPMRHGESLRGHGVQMAKPADLEPIAAKIRAALASL